MGAAWVLRSDFCSLLTSDMEYKQMTGVVNNSVISIKVDNEDAPARLDELKDKLIDVFGLKPIVPTKWERNKKDFLDAVKDITYTQKKSIAQLSENIDDKEFSTNELESFPQSTNLFEKLYLPAFDHIFELLDLDHFSVWGYTFVDCIVLSKSMFINLNGIVGYVKSRPKHSEYESWDSLMGNLSLLIKDFINVFSQYVIFKGNEYGVELFYKRMPNNPNYDVDVKAYKQHILLLFDIVLEMVRLCNFILCKIRKQYPEYKKDLGVLYIDDDPSSPDLLYKEDEISDAPYPGIEKFIKDRSTRELYYGDNPRIGIDGYEKP